MLFDLGVLMDFLTEKLFIATFRNCQLVEKSSRHIVINSLSAPIYCRHGSDCEAKNTSAVARRILRGSVNNMAQLLVQADFFFCLIYCLSIQPSFPYGCNDLLSIKST